MLYELGRVLSFNNAKWGFIDYKDGRLIVFSIKDKKKVAFKISESLFNNLYSNSSYETSQETIDFALNEEKEREALLSQLKPGVVFIGSDNKEYTFLKFKGKQVIFYDNTNEFSAKVGFIKSLTGKIDDTYIDHLSVVKTKKEYKSLTNEEKVKIAVNYCRDCYSHEGTEFEILEIGNIISGLAYYHEVDDYYNLIGLQIKFKYKFDFQDDFSTQVGFFPIYIGRIADYYPISFEESFGNLDFKEYSYTNGLGDKLEVEEILIKKETLNKITV